MKIKDLDEIILEKRDALFLTGNLDILGRDFASG